MPGLSFMISAAVRSNLLAIDPKTSPVATVYVSCSTAPLSKIFTASSAVTTSSGVIPEVTPDTFSFKINLEIRVSFSCKSGKDSLESTSSF